MADAVLHSQAVNYPSFSAMNNMPLKVGKTIETRLTKKVTRFVVTAARAATTDPWQIEVARSEDISWSMWFRGDELDIDTGAMNWRSQADLNVKFHARPIKTVTIPYKGDSGGARPFVKKNAGHPTGYSVVSVAEMGNHLSAKIDDLGNISIVVDGDEDDFLIANRYTGEAALGKIFATILADTTHTDLAYETPCYIESDGTADGPVSITEILHFKEMAGTAGLTVGNYGADKVAARFEVPATGSYDAVVATKLVKQGEAVSVPGPLLDHMRKSVSNAQNVYMFLTMDSDNGGVSTDVRWWASTNNPDTEQIIQSINALDPSGVLEVGFDQENAMNVIAAAAFAGLAGLASVGVATELRQLLENSPLVGVFQQVAVALGATTAAVLSGYVSALIAAYTNGWITNEELFDLGQHTVWIQQGYKTMALAIASGAAIAGIGGLLSYVGVTTDVVSTAIMAAGGAGAGAGIALAMCSSMAHVVRHAYWGE